MEIEEFMEEPCLDIHYIQEYDINNFSLIKENSLNI